MCMYVLVRIASPNIREEKDQADKSTTSEELVDRCVAVLTKQMETRRNTEQEIEAERRTRVIRELTKREDVACRMRHSGPRTNVTSRVRSYGI